MKTRPLKHGSSTQGPTLHPPSKLIPGTRRKHKVEKHGKNYEKTRRSNQADMGLLNALTNKVLMFPPCATIKTRIEIHGCVF